MEVLGEVGGEKGEVWLEDGGEVGDRKGTGERWATGRGRGRGGATGRGRGRGGVTGRVTGRGKNFVPSTIPWKSVDIRTDTATTQPLTFTETAGPRIDLPSNPQAVDFLSTFVDEDILGHIMDETNR